MIGGGQIRGAFFNFFCNEKKPLFLHLLDAALSFYNNLWTVQIYPYEKYTLR